MPPPAPVDEPEEPEPPVDPPCTDDPSFEDKNGYTCEDWKQYDCVQFGASEFNMSEEEIQELVDNCCEACAPAEEESPDEECEDCLDFPGYRLLCDGIEEPAKCK